MKINEIEYIIEKQIEKFYGKAINSNCTEIIRTKENNLYKEITRNYIIICGNEMPPEKLTEEEKIRWALVERRVKFSYISNSICVTVDEHWTDEELNDFLNKTINQKDIIESINSKLIELRISGIHARHTFKGTEFATKEYKEWRQKQNLFIRMLENKLKNIGILKFNLEEIK